MMKWIFAAAHGDFADAVRPRLVASAAGFVGLLCVVLMNASCGHLGLPGLGGPKPAWDQAQPAPPPTAISSTPVRPGTATGVAQSPARSRALQAP